MKKVKINYRTQYDTTNQICGYVMAEDKGEYYLVSRRAYNRALKNRTIGGVAGIIFEGDKPVIVDFRIY